MNRRTIYRKGTFDILRSLFVPVVFTVMLIIMITYGLRQTQISNNAEGLRILEDSIRRAVITAYAIEGRFPPTIAHIEENFGLYIDRTRYVVHYRPFGTNIMPDIAVFELR